MRRGAPSLSLKGRALQLLAQRDQSRLELRRKLLAHARKQQKDPLSSHPLSRKAGEGRGEGPPGDSDAPPVDPAQAELEVDAVLDWLEANRYFSEARFVESRVHAREARFGNQRIKAELAQHGAALTPEQAERLKASELERAAAVLARRYPEPPNDARERASRQRFLAARGFSAEVIGRVTRAGDARATIVLTKE